MESQTSRSYCTRRRALSLLCVGGVGALAGCLADDDSEAIDDSIDTEDGADDQEPADNPRLRELLTLESTYVMELDGPLGVGTITVHDGDTHTTWEMNGMEMEVYRVGSKSYIVVGEDCFKPVGESDDEIFEPDVLVEEFGDSRPTATETLDGRDAFRFEVDDGYLYVSVTSGHIVRFEDQDGGGHIDFHSWGDTDPISPPETECIEQ